MTLGVVLTLLAVVWLWLIDTYIPEVVSEGEPGPRALPILLGVLLGILGVALAVSRPAGPPADEKDLSSAGPALRTGEDPSTFRTALATFGLLLAYAFLLDRIGFISATAALMLTAMAGVLGMRRWVFMAVFAVAFAAGTWLVFNTLLGIPLPRDPWIASLQ